MESVITNPSENPSRDSLLDALVIVTHLCHRPHSAEALVAGVPLDEGRLTPDLFVRCAERAGFAARITRRELGEISPRVLPAVLLLKNDQSCVLTAMDDEAAEVIFADPADSSEMAQVRLEHAELERLYTGQAIYVKPVHRFGDAIRSLGGTDHWFWDVIRNSRGIYAEVLVASLLVNLFALVSPLFIMNVYDRVVPNQAVETLWVLASGVIIVFLFDLIMKALRGYFIDVAGKRADILLSSRTFSKVLDIQMQSRPGSVGSFANNLQEFDSFREFFTSTTLVAVIDLPFVLLFILLIYGIGGPVAWVPLIAIPLVLAIGALLQRPLRDLITRSFSEASRKHAMLVEALTGLDTIKGVRGEGVMQRRWEEFNARLARLGLRSRFLSLSAINVAQFVQQIATIMVVITGVYRIMAGEMSVGGLIACTILTGRALAPMAQVATILTRYHHSLAAYRSINNVMALPTERPQGRTFVERPRLRGAIAFREVTFSYPRQQVPALRNVSLNIEPGQKVALVGRMGSGKSTLQKLILNFYQPAAGALLIDGTDINQIDPNDLRRNIGYVPQEIMLFNGTVRENIVLGMPHATDRQVLEAAAISGLDEFVNQHPHGFDLEVGERGANLSGGQRQSIAIARALLADPPILLFDEPTNSMDNTTEQHFISQLRPRLAEKTLVLVTHKTSMLNLVDHLAVLNEGNLVSFGPKEQILKALAGGTQGG